MSSQSQSAEQQYQEAADQKQAQLALVKKSYVKTNAGLTTVPAKVGLDPA